MGPTPGYGIDGIALDISAIRAEAIVTINYLTLIPAATLDAFIEGPNNSPYLIALSGVNYFFTADIFKARLENLWVSSVSQRWD